MGTFRYKLFISYSHRDKDWSAWLQRSLERYRVPKRLVGSAGEFGAIPRRLTPVFRDREDLSSASDLSASVKKSLESSESLVVICSPAAAQSRWVNEEIRYFRSLGREDRIFAVVVDGDPQSDDPEQLCFPSMLTTNPDGSRREPMAADARKFADGKLLAKLKIIAGILGIPLDTLRRRDMQRRHRLWMASASSAVAIAVVMSILTGMAVTARIAAENRRQHAEELVEYMVGDLKTKLDEVGRLDILEGMGGRVSEYLETLDPGELTDESLIQQAQVWRQLGEVGMEQGDYAGALPAFSASRDVLAELFRRSPENTKFLYELGNAEYWVGYLFLETGEFDKAEERLTAYLDYAEQLVSMEPSNAKWLMEESYAHNNLAALNVMRRSGDSESTLEHIRAAVRLNKEVIEMDPVNPTYQSELATTLAWLADTQLMECNLGDALVARRESVAVARKQAEESPRDVRLKGIYAAALTGVANVALQVGLSELALQNFQQAQDIFGQMSRIEPSNVDYRFGYLMHGYYIAEVMAESGRFDESLARMESLREPLSQVLTAESHENLRRYVHWVSYLLSLSDMKWQNGDVDEAASLLDEAMEHLRGLIDKNIDFAAFAKPLLTARFQCWQQRGGDLLALPGFSEVEIRYDSQDRSCANQANLVRQAIVSQDLENAQRMTADLLARGYYEPAFVRTCRKYDLCQ